jgi:hypothetical protein
VKRFRLSEASSALTEKRQRTAALQNLPEIRWTNLFAKRPGVRQSSAALILLLVAAGFDVYALELGKEIERMPKEKRPTAEQIEAAKQEEAEQKKYQEELWKKLEPQLQEWAKKGKPYLPRAVFPTDLPQADIPAFPGAEGAGSHSFGGRGGAVFVVTNLADSGPGSFREACEAAGPRTVIFGTSGIIRLKSPIHILAPYITIAGQTAPGDGVCIAGRTTHVDTHDVIIRYMRFRRGATNLFDRDDCLGGNPIGNVIVDHCSASWGLDENLSMYRHMYRPKEGEAWKLPTLNLTIQWCISSEALNKYEHAFGGTWGGNNTSFHHNLFACNTARNASIGMSYDFNFINNVLFNWRHRTLDGGDQGSRVNCVNNYYKPGPATFDSPVRYRIGQPQASTFRPDPTLRYGKWYVAGNYVEGNEKVTRDNWDGGVQFRDTAGSDSGNPVVDPGKRKALIKRSRVMEAFPMAPVKTESAKKAYESVLAGAGARLPRQDAVDARIIEQVRTGKVGYGKNGIIIAPEDVGGWPEYKSEPAPLDSDHDGMPDEWEKKYGLDPNDPSDAAKDLDGDGYTNLEEYLNGTDPTKAIDYTKTENNVNTLRMSKSK